jgi:hypothetical protein
MFVKNNDAIFRGAHNPQRNMREVDRAYWKSVECLQMQILFGIFVLFFHSNDEKNQRRTTYGNGEWSLARGNCAKLWKGILAMAGTKIRNRY